MFDWIDFARQVLRSMDKKIERALRKAGVQDNTIDASVLRGELNDGIVLPPHAAEHEDGGGDPLDLGSLAGTLTNDQHGNLAGGTRHTEVVAGGDAGFMSGADKTKLDGITAGAAVTSVALSAPAQFSVSGSPGTGAVSLALAWANQAINTVFAGPGSGSSGAPSFRALVIADLPVASSGTNDATKVVRADDSRLSDARTPSFGNQSINTFPGGPNSGGTGAVTWRTLTVEDMAALLAAANEFTASQTIKALSSGQARKLTLRSANSVGAGTGGTLEVEFNDNGSVVGRLLAAIGNATASDRYFGFIAQDDRDGTHIPIRFWVNNASSALRTVLFLGAGADAGKAVIGGNSTTHLGTLTVYASAVGDKGIVFRAAGSHTASLLETQDSSGNALWAILAGGAQEMIEITAPAAGATNSARLFARDNGSGKTQLAVRFATGAIQVLATEP